MENTVVKVTKRMDFEKIKAILEELGRTELADRMAHEIELLDKKSANRSKTMTKAQKLGIECKDEIYSAMLGVDNEKGMTCTDISILVNNKYTPQKIRPQLKILIEEGKVENVVVKGVSLFKVVEE